MTKVALNNVFQAGRRLWIIVVALLVAAVITLSGDLHEWFVGIVAMAEPVISRSPYLGLLIFVLLAALSAVLMFFSSLLLVPIGIQVWGSPACFLLLWLGWFLGGVLTYSIGRFLGRPVVERMLSSDRISYYEQQIPQLRTFQASVMTQLAFPSDIAGYFFGLLKVPAPLYLGGLLVAELPYALGTVFLGAAFVERQSTLLWWLAGGALTVATIVWVRRHRRSAP
jgi:uncharacterized membrane protein YdjX (TVP38/TMEM64 family)